MTQRYAKMRECLIDFNNVILLKSISRLYHYR